MKRTELLNTMRPGKRQQAIEMALRPEGVTSFEMVATLGMPLINALNALHLAGLATLICTRHANGYLAYHLLTDESLTAWQLKNQQLRREAFKRMQAEPRYEVDTDF